MTAGPLPDRFHPPPGGWTAGDLDRLPASAVELAAPHHLWIEAGTTVRPGGRRRPEPDVLVVDAPLRDDRASYLSEEVVLAVGIVSDESAVRDRETGPLEYAKAGIRHFRRAEEENRAPVVHVHELDDTTGAYVAAGIHRDEPVVPVPFPVEIDPTAPYRR